MCYEYDAYFYIGLSGVGMMFSSMASGNDAGGLQSPACGVVCDPYICVSSDGISPELTRKYLGEKAAENLQSLQGYDPSEFTFSNGVFCDVKEKLCRDDRYFGVDGKRSGKINQTTTKMLFMCRGDVLFTLCSIRHCLLFVINLLSDREEWGVNVYDGRVPVG